jgi:hypothetical protein
MDWHHIKEMLEQGSGLDMDALHVHAGVLGQLAAALLLRRRLSSPLPWLLVLAAILANEVYDFQYDPWPERGRQIGESVKDIWNTMLLPSIILLAARYRPTLFARAEPDPDGSAADPG